MKYLKQVEKIKSGSMTRTDLEKLKRNAVEIYNRGDLDAKDVIDAIHSATPADAYVLFMGFCPDGDFENRQDEEWKADGICTFTYVESEQQMERFNSICVGDLVVLKKREQFGKTMKLYGHGRVTGIAYDERDLRYLEMNWSDQDQIIEVPLMGCNSTVDIRDMATVENEMPAEFYRWLSNEQEENRAG